MPLNLRYVLVVLLSFSYAQAFEAHCPLRTGELLVFTNPHLKMGHEPEVLARFVDKEGALTTAQDCERNQIQDQARFIIYSCSNDFHYSSEISVPKKVVEDKSPQSFFIKIKEFSGTEKFFRNCSN